MKQNWRQGDQERITYPTGTYKVKVDRWEYTTATTGTEQVRWFGTVVDHEDYEGKSIVAHTPLTEASLWKIATFMACHVDVSKASNMDVKSTAWESMLDKSKGRTMYWRMEESSYNGRQTSKAQEFSRDKALDLLEYQEFEISEPEFLNLDLSEGEAQRIKKT